MEEALEPSWQHYRDVLSESDKRALVSEAQIGEENDLKFPGGTVESDFVEELLYHRDPDGSAEEEDKQRAVRGFMEEYARLLGMLGIEDIERRIRGRRLPGLDKELVQIADGAMKDTYRSVDSEHIVQIPQALNFGDTPRENLEQALIWMNTNEKLQEEGIPVATDYDMIISQHRGNLAPAVIGEFRPGLVEYQNLKKEDLEMFADRRNERGDLLEKKFRKRGIQLANLMINGEVAYNEQVEDFVQPPYTGLAYDQERDDVVVYDMGELGEEIFQLEPQLEIDSYEEFVKKHGIREQAEKYLENINLDY